MPACRTNAKIICNTTYGKATFRNWIFYLIFFFFGKLKMCCMKNLIAKRGLEKFLGVHNMASFTILNYSILYA